MSPYFILALALVPGSAVLYYAHWVLVRRRFVAITRGRVYQSAAMPPRTLLRFLARHRIETVIDFRGADDARVILEARTLTQAGLRHINIPVGRLPSIADIAVFNRTMLEEMRRGRGILLHCKDGQGRAVAFAAIYRIEMEGWSARAAYRGASRLPPALRFVNLLFPQAGLLARSNPKTQLILNYSNCHLHPDLTQAGEQEPAPALERPQ